MNYIQKIVTQEVDRVTIRKVLDESLNIESPFFLVKACWLYEHAPYFFFCDGGDSEDRDSLVIEFAEQYESRFLKDRVAIDTWEKIENPRRVRVTTFWESKILRSEKGLCKGLAMKKVANRERCEP